MMKRRLIYILPLLFVLASCGSSYQFTSQRFQDGIYTRPAAPAEPVHIYSEEEIEAKAAANITLKEYEEAKESAFTSGLYLGMGMSFGYGWHNPWYDNPWYRGYGYWDRWHWDYYHWDPWHYNIWADPWDYWYWDSWHYGYYYPHYHYPVGGRPIRPQYGLSSDGSRYYGSRLDTQVGGSRVSRPGSGRSNYRRGVNSSGSYGSAGSAVISRPSSSSSRPSAVSPSSQGSSGNRNYSRVVPGSSSSRENNASRSSQPASTTTRSQNNNYNFNTNTNRSSSSSFGGGSYGGSSYGGGSGGGSRGGGGGGSRGGGRR